MKNKTEKCCDNKDYKKPKDPKFECVKCGRKSGKSKEICKPIKIDK